MGTLILICLQNANTVVRLGYHLQYHQRCCSQFRRRKYINTITQVHLAAYITVSHVTENVLFLHV